MNKREKLRMDSHGFKEEYEEHQRETLNYNTVDFGPSQI
jgi:hypothetical protein